MSQPLESPPTPLPAGRAWSWGPADQAWTRVYHRVPGVRLATTLRRDGPLGRFDHHRPSSAGPDGRAIAYLARDFMTCAVEVFNERHARVCPNLYAAKLRTTATASYQELRNGGALAIGAMAELSTGSVARDLSQQWARRIYEERDVVGIHYSSAHDEGECLAVWERAPALQVVDDGGVAQDFPLHQPEVWDRLEAELPLLGWSIGQIDAGDCPRCRRHGLA